MHCSLANKIMNEIFDIVDKIDRVLGQASRFEIHEKGLLHRSIHIFCRTGPNKWVLQRRSSQKDLDPLMWTTSCSGHVDTGESYLQAAVRECREELGVHVSAHELSEILRLSPCFETGNEFVRVYLLQNFIHPLPDLDEISEIFVGGLDEINQMLTNNRSGFSKAFRHIFKLTRRKLSHFT